jgi:hypothetical protein
MYKKIIIKKNIFICTPRRPCFWAPTAPIHGTCVETACTVKCENAERGTHERTTEWCAEKGAVYRKVRAPEGPSPSLGAAPAPTLLNWSSYNAALIFILYYIRCNK